jgi:hypothetical protein
MVQLCIRAAFFLAVAVLRFSPAVSFGTPALKQPFCFGRLVAQSLTSVAIDDLHLPTQEFHQSDETDSKSNFTLPSSSSNTNERISWVERLQQLADYRQEHGDLMIPKRYSENPSLGTWVNKQRQHKRKFCLGDYSGSLTETRIQHLNEIEFCWDASVAQGCPKGSTTGAAASGEEIWSRRLEEIRHYQNSNESPFVRVPSQSPLGNWINRQRKEYVKWKHGEPSNHSKKKDDALNEIDSIWWKSVRQRQWDLRYQELQEYRKVHGDCCVPVSSSNKRLANWVRTQRRNYKLKEDGNYCRQLTDERFEQLNAVGFVWDRWEFEFEKKGNVYS